MVSTFIIFFIVESLSSQNIWDTHLAYYETNEWDTLKCNNFYPKTSVEQLFGSPETMIKIKGGIDTLNTILEYPSIPRPIQLEGQAWVRLVVTKDGQQECLQVSSLLSTEYVQSVVSAIKKLEFEPAENRGKKIDDKFVLPITFHRENQKKK